MKKFLITFFSFMIMFLVVGCFSDNEEKAVYFEDDYLSILINESVELPIILENAELDEINFEYNENIISLDGNFVIPLSIGSTTLTANIGEVLESIEVNVTFLKGNNNLLSVGSSVRINLVGFDNRDDFIWESENEEVIELNNNIAIAVSPGITNVIVKHKKDPSIITKYQIEVILVAPSLTSTTSYLKVGDQVQMLITNLAELGTEIDDYRWDIVDEDIISINENYIVTANEVGKAILTVSLKDNEKSFSTYEFNIITPTTKKTPFGEPAEGPLLFNIENPSGVVQAGEELDVSIVGGKDNYNYIWVAHDSTIVSATDDGRLIGFREGRTKISVYSKFNLEIFGEFYVTVIGGEPNVNYRERIVQAALSEETYTQGPNKKNKFGEWYQFDNVDWCAIFVSWAANQAGIGTDVILRYALCSAGLEWFDEQGLYHRKGEYEPQRGDIVFFRNADGRIGHTGIVLSVDKYNVYTIEGNTSGDGIGGRVFRKTRSLEGTYVDGFASPDYPLFTE